MIKKAILYQIVNSVNNLKYIGVTTTKLRERWNVHLYRLRHGNATKNIQTDFDTYGEKSFFIEKIKEGSLEDMLSLEKDMTKFTSINGYNIIIGGGDREERKQSASIFHAKKDTNPDWYARVYEKISESNKGKIVSKETRRKMSEKRKGVKWDEIKKANRSKLYSGEGNPNAGKYRMYLNIATGIFYNTPEMYSYLSTTKSGLRNLFKKKDIRINNFIKV